MIEPNTQEEIMGETQHKVGGKRRARPKKKMFRVI
jgi:hypothetical protein